MWSADLRIAMHIFCSTINTRLGELLLKFHQEILLELRFMLSVSLYLLVDLLYRDAHIVYIVRSNTDLYLRDFSVCTDCVERVAQSSLCVPLHKQHA